MKKHEAHKRTPWPRFIKIGRTTVKIYRRKMPSGNWGYRIPNYSSGKRRFDCHTDEAQAIEAATHPNVIWGIYKVDWAVYPLNSLNTYVTSPHRRFKTGWIDWDSQTVATPTIGRFCMPCLSSRWPVGLPLTTQ